MEFFTRCRRGCEWQSLDEAHCCRYCSLLEYDQTGNPFCKPYRDALEGFTFADDATLPGLLHICDDYELNHFAFWLGEGRSPQEADFRCDHVPQTILMVPTIGNALQ